MKQVKAITADTIQELELKLNEFAKVKDSFATQVFQNNGKYEALVYFNEVFK